MKILLTFVLLFSLQSMAGTSATFVDDGAVVVVQGLPGDKDSTSLYNSIRAPVIEHDGFLMKSVAISGNPISPLSEDILKISCKISSAIPNYGFCSLAFVKSMFSAINPISGSILLGINDFISAPIAVENFNLSDDVGTIFRSSDNKLFMKATKDSYNNIVSFTVTYN